MNVLFVCKHNRFRSKVAEALFNTYAGPLHRAKSAGVALDVLFPYVADHVKKALQSYGVAHVVDAPHLISDSLLAWAERIIVVADNVDATLFPASKREVWLISDCDQDDTRAIQLRIRDINDRVRSLLRSFATKRR